PKQTRSTMNRFMKWGLVLAAALAVGGAAAGPYGWRYFQRKPIDYRDAEVSRGRIVSVVNSTGTVKAGRTGTVGTFVSGPIVSIMVDFNSEVKKDDLLAKIDERIYKAAVDRDRATLNTQKANVAQAKAKWQQAKNDELRSHRLQKQSTGFISES